MFIRSIAPVEWMVGIAVLIIAVAMFIDVSTPLERCLIARAKIEVYEAALMDPEQYIGHRTRNYLIRARVQEIKWCDHPLSREN